jgi:hypothetical protein
MEGREEFRVQASGSTKLQLINKNGLNKKKTLMLSRREYPKQQPKITWEELNQDFYSNPKDFKEITEIAN